MGINPSAAILSAAALLVLAACSSSMPEEPPSPVTSATSTSATSSTAAKTTSVALSESIDHVHGLVATAPGELVAGTHSGAMAIAEDGKVSAQGEQRDDLMGMTGETDSDKLASSGHPGANSLVPNPLGLVVSSDAGKTWEAVSRQGETDFHSLAISGKNVIGSGGGATLQVSRDGGKSWADGASLQVAALAYSGDRILATTQSGLQSSTDGGKSFGIEPDSPALVLISAGKAESMLGVDTAGMAWRSQDSGKTWTQASLVGQVQAIAAYDNNIGYAIAEKQLVLIS